VTHLLDWEVTGQELFEHVRTLAADHDVLMWICATCQDAGEAYGEAISLTGWDNPLVVLTQLPDTPEAYLVALHELGHHADPCWTKGLRLDREVYAWRWAIATSLIPFFAPEWTFIRDALRSYAADRRYKLTPDFECLLAEAERNADA
jgi:hypothetical protein